jgi:hypothetical protein
MAWVTGTTRSTGYVVSASDWNQDVIANIAYLKGQASVATAFENAVTVALTLAVTGASTLTGAVGMPGGATITGLVLPTYADFTQGTAPASPGAGQTRIYSKADGTLYYLAGTSTVEQPLGTSGYARSFLLMGG